MDTRGILLISGVLTLLCLATGALMYLRRRPSGIDAATLSTCRSRVYAWWLLFGSLICALLLGTVATVTLFGAISFWALREYVTLTPTRPADHRTLVGVFFLLTPLQFILVGLDSEWFTKVFHTEPYFVFSVLIPSLAFLILPATVATSGDPKFFLERIAKLQVGLLICVYSLSFAPAILTMKLPNSKPTVTAAEIVAVDLEAKVLKPLEEAVTLQAANAGNNGASEKTGEGAAAAANADSQKKENAASQAAPLESEYVETIETQGKISTPHKKLDAANLTLLFVFVFLTQVNDVAQYFWSRAFPRHKIAPYVNSSKTTEGALLGALTTALVAVALIYFTPFTNWRQAALAGVIISAMGFAGNMTMSAIKRDQGVGDYGELVDGHSGVLDRIDSLCFAAPVFYHYVRLCLD